jgi:imidazolonepropionase
VIQTLKHVARLYTCTGSDPDDAGLIADAAIAWEGERICWVGPTAALPVEFDHAATDLSGKVCFLAPGLVDCHTHLAFGGWRADEFALRCRGATYQEIAAAGGGIASTVRKTRAAAEEELYAVARRRLRQMAALGVGTVECKSGYGLTVADELKLLRVYRRLGASTPMRIVSTVLGAHVVPPEYTQHRGDYVSLLTEELLPRVAAEGLAEFCDVFVEDGAFTSAEGRTILEAGKRLGLRPKLHVDQLHDGGGAVLAAEVGAISADHLEYTGPTGIAALARAGVVAVTLPLASLYLRQPPLDARPYQAAGVPVAVATDFNPGTAPCHSLPTALALACIMNRMTPAAALRGATQVAARALALHDVGTLAPRQRMNALLVEAPDVEHWLYRLADPPPARVWLGGRELAEAFPEDRGDAQTRTAF